MKTLVHMFFFAIISLAFLIPSNVAYASGTVSLDPTSGVIDGSGGFIDVVVDSGGEPIDGIAVSLVYDGDISFVDFEQGNICDVDGGERPPEGYEEDIFLVCFILSQSYTGSDGVLATLHFEPTAEGQASVTIVDIDVAGTAEIGDGEGNYTTTMTVPDPAPDSDPDSDSKTTESLPMTSVFSTFGVMLGLTLFCMPLVLNGRTSKKKGLMMKKVD